MHLFRCVETQWYTGTQSSQQQVVVLPRMWWRIAPRHMVVTPAGKFEADSLVSNILYLGTIWTVTDFDLENFGVTHKDFLEKKEVFSMSEKYRNLIFHYSYKSNRKLPHFKLKASSSSKSGSSVPPKGRQTVRHLGEDSQSPLPEDGTSQNIYQTNQMRSYLASVDYGMMSWKLKNLVLHIKQSCKIMTTSNLSSQLTSYWM